MFAAALGQPQPAPPRHGADRARLPGQPARGWQAAAAAELQLLSQSQDTRGEQQPGPQCPARARQCESAGGDRRRQACDLGGHEKKELVGDFKNNGRELRLKGDPGPVRVHDFKIPELGKVASYGAYDITANHGWVSVGISADTGAFAVESIRRWWHKLGKPRYLNAARLTITADCGGSNGPQRKLWKCELQRLANEAGLTITVAHLPPGTSKWNRIKHRLFAFITMNWRGRPLVSHQVIVQLIGATTTDTGLKVCCEIDVPSRFTAAPTLSIFRSNAKSGA
jgi:hypothetical protein